MPGFMVSDRVSLYHYDSKQEYFYNYTWDIDNVFSSSNNTIKIGLKDCTLPTFTVNKETVEGSNIEYKFAKSVSWEDVSVTWYDVEGLYEIILEWRKSIWSADTAQGLRQAAAYKKQTVINSYLGSHLGDFSSNYQKYTLVNSWPSSIKYGDLTYTSSEVKSVTVTITYDWAIEQSVADKP